jgi:hypothetical protein
MEARFKKYLLYYSIAAGAAFFLIMAFYTGFKLSAPLDDAFIYFQYAKNLIHGHFFEYVAGEGYSSGATSFLYAFLLAPFALVFRGIYLVIPTYIGGIIALYFCGYFIFEIIKKLTDSLPAAIFGAALYVTNGNILWGFFSGMEIGIFSLLLAWSLYLLASGASPLKQALSLSLLALIRPEGFIVVLVLAFVKLLNKISDPKNEKFIPYLIPIAAGSVYFLVNYHFTGDFMPNTMRAKSNFSMGYYAVTEALKDGWNYYLDFLNKVFNGGAEHYFPKYVFFIFLLGIMPGAAAELKSKKAGFFIVAFFWFFLGVMSTVFSSFASVHNYRYTMPFIIIFTIFLAYGINIILEKSKELTAGKLKHLPAAVFTLFFAFNFFTIAANAVDFGRDCRDILHQSIAAGKWIKDNVPAGEHIAINDAGAITYFSDAHVYDLVGLVTNGEARDFRGGLATVFEKLEHIRPKYWMVHLGWFNYEGYTVFKKPRLTTFNIEKEPAYFVVGSPEVGVETDFTLFNSGDTMKVDHMEKDKFVIKDSLDIADTIDEDKHGYRIFTKRIPQVPGTLFEEAETTGVKGGRVLEGGRITGGGEEFTVTSLEPGEDLKIVRRVYESPESVQKVYIDGVVAAQWDNTATGKEYSEQEITVPGSFIKKNSARVKLEETKPNRYNAFHYWFLQRRKI